MSKNKSILRAFSLLANASKMICDKFLIFFKIRPTPGLGYNITVSFWYVIVIFFCFQLSLGPDGILFTKILSGSTAGGPPRSRTPPISAAVVVPSRRRRRRRRLLPARSRHRRRPLRITNKPPSSVFIFITGARPPINKYFDISYIIILHCVRTRDINL